MYLGVLTYTINGVLIREEDQYQTSPYVHLRRKMVFPRNRLVRCPNPLQRHFCVETTWQGWLRNLQSQQCLFDCCIAPAFYVFFFFCVWNLTSIYFQSKLFNTITGNKYYVLVIIKFDTDLAINSNMINTIPLRTFFFLRSKTCYYKAKPFARIYSNIRKKNTLQKSLLSARKRVELSHAKYHWINHNIKYY